MHISVPYGQLTCPIRRAFLFIYRCMLLPCCATADHRCASILPLHEARKENCFLIRLHKRPMDKSMPNQLMVLHCKDQRAG